jgi:hypothetical protein
LGSMGCASSSASPAFLLPAHPTCTANQLLRGITLLVLDAGSECIIQSKIVAQSLGEEQAQYAHREVEGKPDEPFGAVGPTRLPPSRIMSTARMPTIVRGRSSCSSHSVLRRVPHDPRHSGGRRESPASAAWSPPPRQLPRRHGGVGPRARSPAL